MKMYTIYKAEVISFMCFQGGIGDVVDATLFFIKFALLLPQLVLVFFVEPKPSTSGPVTEKTPLLAGQKSSSINHEV